MVLFKNGGKNMQSRTPILLFVILPLVPPNLIAPPKSNASMRLWKKALLQRKNLRQKSRNYSAFEGYVMKYELSENEIQLVQKYRDLLPEFQEALEKHAQILFELQTRIVRESLK